MQSLFEQSASDPRVLENAHWAPSYRRMCKVLLRNDWFRIGKVTGQARLKGPAWDFLREVVFYRDLGRCVDCGKKVILEKFEWNSMHCAHIKSKGSGRSDLPSNCVCKCLESHMKEHQEGRKSLANFSADSR